MAAEIRTVQTGGIEMRYLCFDGIPEDGALHTAESSGAAPAATPDSVTAAAPSPDPARQNLVILPGLSIVSVLESADAIISAYAPSFPGYRIWVFDRRSNLPPVYPVREMARDTGLVMDALGLSWADVFGASQGGMMAQFLAIDRPDLVRKLVLGSTLSRSMEDADEPAATAATVAPDPKAAQQTAPESDGTGNATATIGEWMAAADSGDAAVLWRAFAKKVYTPSFFAKYQDLILAGAASVTQEDMARFRILAAGARGVNAYDELDRIQCPVLVLAAGEDRVVGVEASREIAEKLRCELYIYEGYGHAVYDEAPDYRERILRFLQA